MDSYHIARFDNPFIEFFTGLHKDFHQPSDEADLIHYYEELGRILEVMYDLTDFYAQGAGSPPSSVPHGFLLPTNKARRASKEKVRKPSIP